MAGLGWTRSSCPFISVATRMPAVRSSSLSGRRRSSARSDCGSPGGPCPSAPASAALREFLAVNHREPAGFRVGSLGNAWALGLLKDVSQAFSGLLQVGVFPIGVTGRVCMWLPEREAEGDLWVPTKGLGNLPWFLGAMGG